MSGHNKWTTIKHKKEKTDAQKGKIFTKIGREIAIAVREGGSADPATNGKLRDVIAKADVYKRQFADLGRFNLWRPMVVERMRGSNRNRALPG